LKANSSYRKTESFCLVRFFSLTAHEICIRISNVQNLATEDINFESNIQTSIVKLNIFYHFTNSKN